MIGHLCRSTGELLSLPLVINFWAHHYAKIGLSHFHSKAILILTLQINDTIQSYVDFDGTFYKSGQESAGVPFSGQLSYDGSLSYLRGDFRTQSAWRNAFGIEYLAMSNLRLR